MAAALDDRRELLELVAFMHEALNVASRELWDLAETHHPVPDDLHVLLTEHKAMSMVLKEAPGKDRQQLVAAYRLTAKNVSPTDYEMPASPVLDEVREQVDRVLEMVRRSAMLVPAVGDAVRAP